MWRVFAYSFSLAMIVAVLWPLIREPEVDSYPLSTYPMFSFRRERPWISYLRGYSREGEAIRLPPRVCGNDEVMQAAVTVNRAVMGGLLSMHRLCHDVRQSLKTIPELKEVTRMEIVSEQYDPILYFQDSPDRAVLVERINYRCRMERP